MSILNNLEDQFRSFICKQQKPTTANLQEKEIWEDFWHSNKMMGSWSTRLGNKDSWWPGQWEHRSCLLGHRAIRGPQPSPTLCPSMSQSWRKVSNVLNRSQKTAGWQFGDQWMETLLWNNTTELAFWGINQVNFPKQVSDLDEALVKSVKAPPSLLNFGASSSSPYSQMHVGGRFQEAPHRTIWLS